MDQVGKIISGAVVAAVFALGMAFAVFVPAQALALEQDSQAVPMRLQVQAASKAPALSKTTLTLRSGLKASLKVKNAPAGAKISFKTSNKAVVVTTAKGQLIARKTGNAKITAIVKTATTTKRLICKVAVKPGIVAVLDSGAPSGQEVAKAITVTNAGARGPQNGHAFAQINNIKKEAPKAKIVSIRVTDKKGIIYSSAVAKGVDQAIKNNASVIYYSCYAKGRTDEEYAAVQRALAKGISIVGPAGNDHGKDARKLNWMTNEKGPIVVGAWGTSGIAEVSNKHANVYVAASTTSTAAARYAGMLANGKLYGVHKTA